MKTTFEKALLAVRDLPFEDREAYRPVMEAAKASQEVRAMILALLLANAIIEGDPTSAVSDLTSAMRGAFVTGIMVGMEMEKESEPV